MSLPAVRYVFKLLESIQTSKRSSSTAFAVTKFLLLTKFMIGFSCLRGTGGFTGCFTCALEVPPRAPLLSPSSDSTHSSPGCSVACLLRYMSQPSLTGLFEYFPVRPELHMSRCVILQGSIEDCR